MTHLSVFYSNLITSASMVRSSLYHSKPEALVIVASDALSTPTLVSGRDGFKLSESKRN